jgi:hypothetical protein
MAAADAEGSVLGAAALAGAGLGEDAGVGGVLGDAAVEQAAIAIASAGPRRTMDRFMTDVFLSCIRLGGATGADCSLGSI